MEASHKNSLTFTEPEPELLHRDVTRGGSHDAADLSPPSSKDKMIIFATMNPIKQVLTKKEEENERVNSS